MAGAVFRDTQFLGDIAEKRFHLLVSMLPFHSLSVIVVHCAQAAEDIDKISFEYGSPISLPDCIKIWLTSINPFLLNFVPVTHAC